jgi:hypothetical protein
MLRNILVRTILASAIAVLALPALAFEKGEWVLGRYKGGEYWFPGVVRSDDGGTITVVYDDGDVEKLERAHVKAYNWKVGSRVSCRWKSGDKWYPGRITRLAGSDLSVAYDDGDREDTKTGLCRSK